MDDELFRLDVYDICSNCETLIVTIEENGLALRCKCQTFPKGKIFFNISLTKAVLRNLMEDLNK